MDVTPESVTESPSTGQNSILLCSSDQSHSHSQMEKREEEEEEEEGGEIKHMAV